MISKSSTSAKSRSSRKRVIVPANIVSRLYRAVEHKVQTVSNNSVAAAGGQIASLCNVPQGTDINDRIGRHIRPLYVDYVVTVYPSATPPVYDSLMVSLWLDLAAQSSTPSFTDVFDITTSNAGTALANVTKTGSRFRCLMIRDMACNSGGDGCHTIRGRVKLSPFDMEFYASTTAYPYNKGIFTAIGSAVSADIGFNSLWQFVFEDA